MTPRLLTPVFSSLLALSLAAFTRDDIHYWVGEGANRCAVVIDWGGEGRSGHVVLQWDALPPLHGPAMFSPRRHGLGVPPVDGDTSGGDTQDCSAPLSHFRPIFSFDA